MLTLFGAFGVMSVIFILWTWLEEDLQFDFHGAHSYAGDSQSSFFIIDNIYGHWLLCVFFFWFCLNRIKHVLIDFGLRKDNEECGTSKIMKPRITPTRGTKIHFKRYKSNFNGSSIPKVLTFILCAKLKFMVVLSLFWIDTTTYLRLYLFHILYTTKVGTLNQLFFSIFEES